MHGRPYGGPFDPGSSLLTAIATDPVLSTRKLIAEPWDATGEGYAVGGFGANWTEWNDRFRDTTRDFWRGTSRIRDLGYRLSGSSDLYAPARRPWASINFVTAHDGFTLRDLVSYDHKHNEDNGEDNRDGTNNNRSWNCGEEGPTDDPEILALRTRQARNIAATLLLSTGTPMITMGDELWRTQGGNNNAYCQDNEMSWVDWPALPGGDEGQRRDQGHAGVLPTHPGDPQRGPRAAAGRVLRRPRTRWRDGIPDLMWFNPRGLPMTDDDWFDGSRRTLMMWVDGRDVRGHTVGGEPLTDVSWLLVLHAGADPTDLTLPGMPYGSSYFPVLDTDAATGEPPLQPLPVGETGHHPRPDGVAAARRPLPRHRRLACLACNAGLRWSGSGQPSLRVVPVDYLSSGEEFGGRVGLLTFEQGECQVSRGDAPGLFAGGQHERPGDHLTCPGGEALRAKSCPQPWLWQVAAEIDADRLQRLSIQHVGLRTRGVQTDTERPGTVDNGTTVPAAGDPCRSGGRRDDLPPRH